MLAYVLIQVAVGMAPKVLAEVERVEGVVDALIVTGPYDIMLKVSAEDVDDLGKLIVSGIQSVSGIVRTLDQPPSFGPVPMWFSLPPGPVVIGAGQVRSASEWSSTHEGSVSHLLPSFQTRANWFGVSIPSPR